MKDMDNIILFSFCIAAFDAETPKRREEKQG